VPGYKGHLVGGVVVYTAMRYLLSGFSPSICTSFEWLAVCLVGSLFPDVDIKSKGQKIFYRILFGLSLFLLYNGNMLFLAWLGIAGLIPLVVGHRGVFHRMWFLSLLLLFSLFIVKLYAPGFVSIFFFDALFFFVGIISHIWLDMGFKGLFRA